ncbi:MAG TPA: hypothetical protein VE690_21685 [Rhodopila sp.]|nr:hypothetical protein [Rhodopila sp.]
MSNDTGLILAAVERLQHNQELLQQRMGVVQQHLGVLQQSQERLQNSQERLQQSQDRLRADIMTQLERVQDQVTAIHDDIGVNFGATNHARRVHDATRDDVRSLSEVVSSMHRQIHRLQTDVRTLKGEG